MRRLPLLCAALALVTATGVVLGNSVAERRWSRDAPTVPLVRPAA